MKKIINQPDNYIKEMLEGIYIAHKDDLACVDGDLQVLVSKHKKEGKVGIVTGGGSGHLPLFLGYVGKGMIDGCAVGDVFQSPSVDQAIALTRDADQGAGVLSMVTTMEISSHSVQQLMKLRWKMISKQQKY